MEDVRDYLMAFSSNNRLIAIGVMLLIWSPAFSIMVEGFPFLEFPGLTVLLLFVAAGVVLCILAGTKRPELTELQNARIYLDVDTEVYVLVRAWNRISLSCLCRSRPAWRCAF